MNLNRKTYVWAFWITAILRLVCVVPFVIDDDEAWWSAASIAMKSPWDFYRSAVDHKPPGVVWFYWLVNHLVNFFSFSASDPRVIRGAYTLMTIAAAATLGWIARRYSRKSESDSTGWIAATLFLILTAIPTPKLLAVTADGLIINLTIFAYAIALFAEFPGVSIVSGMILGCSLLIKQTAVFFAIPILLANTPRKWSIKEIAGFALGSLLVVVPSIFAVGLQDFIYWNWTYPSQVLITVREKLFHSSLEMTESLLIFAVASLPFVIILAARAFKSVRQKHFSGLRDFRVLWWISGTLAALIGKGLFLHYLLLFIPPFVLLAVDGFPSGNKFSFTWVAIQYVAGCAFLLLPMSGIFWGTDLVYFDQLSRVMKNSLRANERVMIWGGSALPLAYAGVSHVSRFVLPRFAVEPYATEKTSEIFHQELEADPPALVLDLHERGDNQFNNPIESEPYVEEQIRRNYKLYVSELVPWAKFYFLKAPPEKAGLVEITGDEQMRAAYHPFPEEQESWVKLMDARKRLGYSRLVDVDWALRMRAALELLQRQGANPGKRLRAQEYLTRLQPETFLPELRTEIEKYISTATDPLMPPLPIRSVAWWPSVALVELQPKAFH